MRFPRIVIIVAPHERREAIETYGARLTPADIERLLTAPKDEFVRINLGRSFSHSALRRTGLQPDRNSSR